MKKRIIPGVFALLLAGCLFSVTPAAGYFPENGFEPCWLVKKIMIQKPVFQEHRRLYYEVRSGDTLWSLARRWGVKPGTIAAANGIQEDAVLYPGQYLVVPSSDGFIHRVTPGETLWSLSRRYHVSLARLISANRIAYPTSLAVGMELVIPGSAAALAQSSSDGVRWAARGLGSNLAWPLLGAITSFFGTRSGEFHHGLDIAGDYGDLIRAAERGEVVFVGRKPFYGYTVILDHGGGEQTLYGHIEESLVSVGDLVDKGQAIARVGSSGRATGPHLHFEVRRNNKAVDPLPYLTR